MKRFVAVPGGWVFEDVNGDYMLFTDHEQALAKAYQRGRDDVLNLMIAQHEKNIANGEESWQLGNAIEIARSAKKMEEPV